MLFDFLKCVVYKNVTHNMGYTQDVGTNKKLEMFEYELISYD
jgi:hypothetical protein